ncbi:MAG TPA: family 43 glycosylhydrolase [Arachnia sp.]|nr:family 43 glycosylhydrolase [Arachnia sp.]HMT85612.1 family 43 glycosylhydrolase [Arachnia sp.]
MEHSLARSNRRRRLAAVFTAAAVVAGGLTLGAGAPAFADDDEPALIAAYDFEDGTTRDVTGNGNDLTLAGGAAVESYGDKPVGSRALSTRGGTQHAAFPEGMFDGMDEFTLSMNYKNRTSNGNFFTFAVGQDNTRYLFLRTRYQNLYAAITKNSYQNESGTTASLASSIQNAWHNLTLTVSPQEIVIYLDGQPVSSTTNVATTMTELGTDLKAYLGRSFYSGDAYFDGAFDDIQIWDKALSRADMLGSGVIQIEDTEQILAQSTTTEGSKKILNVTLDYWANGGGATGALTDESNLSFDFLTYTGETLTTVDGGSPAAVTDYSEPVQLVLTKENGSTVDYEVRVSTLVMPIRIPGQTDATGVMGMKFFADPEVFADGGKYYIYPTTDGHSQWGGWTIHAFESEDLVTWVDKGVVVNLRDQNLDGTPDSSILPSRTKKAWAPAMAKRDGLYYLYFSGDGQSNVAVSDRPDGGFQLTNAQVTDSIDPAIFRDPATGKWYVAWGQSGIRYAELNDDMRGWKPGTLFTQGITGFREGAYITSREYLGQRTYYFTYSVDDTNSPNYRVAYATATSMAGPWTYRGEILNRDDAKGILGTAHHSILQVPGTDDWYAVYHSFLTDEMRPRLVDQENGLQIATGNKRETRIARLTYTEPTAAEVAAGAVPLINRIPVTFEGVPAERTPEVSIVGAAEVGATLTAEFNATWQGVEWQWQRDGQPIGGAVGESYTVTSADAGSELTVVAVGESTSGVHNNAGTAAARTVPLTSGVVSVEEQASATVSVQAATRCVAGKVVLATTVTNEGSEPVDATVTTPYGSKTVSQLAAGKSVSQAFSTRAASIPAGVATAQAADGSPVEAAYAAVSCG